MSRHTRGIFRGFIDCLNFLSMSLVHPTLFENELIFLPLDSFPMIWKQV